MDDNTYDFDLAKAPQTIIKVIGVGGGGGNGIVVAQKGRLGRAAHAGGHDGVGRAVDRVGEAMYLSYCAIPITRRCRSRKYPINY